MHGIHTQADAQTEGEVPRERTYGIWEVAEECGAGAYETALEHLAQDMAELFASDPHYTEHIDDEWREAMAEHGLHNLEPHDAEEASIDLAVFLARHDPGGVEYPALTEHAEDVEVDMHIGRLRAWVEPDLTDTGMDEEDEALEAALGAELHRLEDTVHDALLGAESDRTARYDREYEYVMSEDQLVEMAEANRLRFTATGEFEW